MLEIKRLNIEYMMFSLFSIVVSWLKRMTIISDNLQNIV